MLHIFGTCSDVTLKCCFFHISGLRNSKCHIFIVCKVQASDHDWIGNDSTLCGITCSWPGRRMA